VDKKYLHSKMMTRLLEWNSKMMWIIQKLMIQRKSLFPTLRTKMIRIINLVLAIWSL